jgi:hypothetical protein
MKRLLIISILLVVVNLALAIDKAAFDILKPGLQKSTGTTESDGYGDKLLRNDVIELTMVSGGYFTIGTVKGKSASLLDDHCAITFGHPYATTSYPVLSVDGLWQKFDEMLTDWWPLFPSQRGDTLIITGEKGGLAGATFELILSPGGTGVELFLRCRNRDAIAHKMGMGFVIDPALGLWGDGCLELAGRPVSNDTLLTAPAIPDHLMLWERAEGARGLGAGINFADKPDKIILANWSDAYDDPSPQFEPSELRTLYDLTLKMFWNERAVAPDQELSCKLSISLENPDFSSSAFMRWDIPSFLSLENGLLFPQQMPTYVQISDIGGGFTDGGTLQVGSTVPLSFTPTEKTISLDAGGSTIEKLDVQSQELYEDKIARTSLRLLKDNVVIDQLTRNVFVPATPVSDTGLVVTVDTVMTGDFPKVALVFGVEIDASGQKVLNLNNQNIFLYENELRIKDFTLGKYSGGGSNLADVVFVLDCSGSMGDDISQVRQYLGEFADSLVAGGYDYRIGVVTFSTTVDDVWDLTNNIEQVKQNLASIELWGGVEDSPAALYRATQLSFRPGSKRSIIWITDEPYPEHTYSKQQIVDRMLSMDIRVHGVGLLDLQTAWFNPIVLPTGGNFYNIGGNFRDILLDVSRMGSQDRFQITYASPADAGIRRQIKLEIHYAGLGGSALVDYEPTVANEAGVHLACYPNPFNPTTNILVRNYNGLKGEVDIFNILGQRVKHFSIDKEAAPAIVWDARDERGLPVGTGFYIVQFSLFDHKGIASREVEKILYLK